MSFRTRFLLVTGSWTAVVAAVLVVLPVVLRHRLPEPVAVHWGLSGVPDNAMPLVAMTLLEIGLWLVIAVPVLVIAAVRGVRNRLRRAWLGAALGWGGAFVLGLTGVTAWANLDAMSWSQARSVDWQAMVVIALSLIVGVLGWRVARRGPDEIVEEASTPGALELREGQRAVWISSSGTSVALMSLGLAFLAGGVGFGVGVVLGSATSWPVLPAFALLGVVGVMTSSVRTRVTDEGLFVALGPWGWPSRRIPVDKIVQARAETCRPAEVGGWGIRWVPGRWTIMIRAGECLVVRYASGRELGISVDDADRGAALVNALVHEHSR